MISATTAFIRQSAATNSAPWRCRAARQAWPAASMEVTSVRSTRRIGSRRLARAPRQHSSSSFDNQRHREIIGGKSDGFQENLFPFALGREMRRDRIIKDIGFRQGVLGRNFCPRGHLAAVRSLAGARLDGLPINRVQRGAAPVAASMICAPSGTGRLPFAATATICSPVIAMS